MNQNQLSNGGHENGSWTLLMIDIRHLRTLVALREAGSLAEAAEQMTVQITQS